MNGLAAKEVVRPVKKFVAILLLTLLCLTGCGADEELVIETAEGSDAEAAGRESEEADASAGTEESDPAEQNIFVYVCGAVKEPGVYELPSGSRVIAAIEAAGGLTEEASLTALNQARLLSDGEQITVLTEEEAEALPASEGTSADAGTHSDGLVNINLAGLSELMTLPGIGEVKAAAVIAYREENGPFARPEDICSVDGIKEKLYSRISTLITV